MSETDPNARRSAMRRRRPRLSADQTRQRMFAAAREIIKSNGVTIDLGDVVLDNVIERADVSRSSAYNQWPTKAAFVNDLLLTVARPGGMRDTGVDAEAMATTEEILLAHWHRLETEGGRRAVLLEVIRQTVARNLESVATFVDWEVYGALVATARGNGNDEGRQLLSAELQRAELWRMRAMSAFYQAMCASLGLRLRVGSASFEHLSVAAAAVVQGLAMRRALVASSPGGEDVSGSDRSLWELLDVVAGPAIDGGTVQWTLAAWTLLGVFDAATEPDPGWRPPSSGRAAVEELRRSAAEHADPARAGARGETHLRDRQPDRRQAGTEGWSVPQANDERELPPLTAREQDVLVELCRPRRAGGDARRATPSNAEIAARLRPPIGAARVSDLISTIYRKYGLTGTKEQNRVELVDLAVSHHQVAREDDA